MIDLNDIEKMTLDEFVSLVKEMRFHQRRYNLSVSKKDQIKETLDPLEKKIDEITTAYFQRQQKLF